MEQNRIEQIRIDYIRIEYNIMEQNRIEQCVEEHYICPIVFPRLYTGVGARCVRCLHKPQEGGVGMNPTPSTLLGDGVVSRTALSSGHPRDTPNRFLVRHQEWPECLVLRTQEESDQPHSSCSRCHHILDLTVSHVFLMSDSLDLPLHFYRVMSPL